MNQRTFCQSVNTPLVRGRVIQLSVDLLKASKLNKVISQVDGERKLSVIMNQIFETVEDFNCRIFLGFV